MRDLDTLRRMTSATITRELTAQVLDTDPRTVTRGCELGQIPHVRVGRRLLVLREPLIAVLEGRSFTSGDDAA
jgi:hypothetical protein